MPPVGLSSGQIDALQKEIMNLGHSAMHSHGRPPHRFCTIPQ